MDFWDLTKLMVRRWRVALPLFLLTLGAVVVVSQITKPDYKATSYVSLVPPPEASDTNARTRNPWLNTGLNSLATAAIITVQGKSVADGLAANGFSRSYTLTLAGPYEPIVTVEAVAPTQAGATGTAHEVAKLLNESVASIQADSGVATGDLITTLPIRGDNVEASSTKLVRTVIMVGVVGVLLTAATTIGVDALARRRRRAGLRPAVATRTYPSDATRTYPSDAMRTHAPDATSAGWGQRPAGPVPARALSIDYPGGIGYGAGEEDPSLTSKSVDHRPVPQPDPIDSTIVLPLTAPSPWSTGERGKHH